MGARSYPQAYALLVVMEDSITSLGSMPNWMELLFPSTSLIELLVRGSAIYLIIFAFLRITHRRKASGLSVADVLVVVLIADAAAPALTGEAVSIADGVILVATVIGWSHALNWLAYRYKPIDHLVHPVPVQLVAGGEILWKAMRRELVTEKELLALLRKEGFDKVASHLDVFLEGDGSISVIEK